MANKILFLMMVVVAAVAVVTKVEGQSPLPDCVVKLSSCRGQSNSTSPSEACCLALQEEARNDFPCVCSAFNDPSLLKALNITSDDAYRVAQACGTDLSACSAPSPSNPNPNPSPSASSKKGDNNKIAWFSFISLVFSWLSMTMMA